MASTQARYRQWNTDQKHIDDLMKVLPFTQAPNPGDPDPDPATLDPDTMTGWPRWFAKDLKAHGKHDLAWAVGRLGPDEVAEIAHLSGNGQANTAPLSVKTGRQIMTATYPDPVWAVPGLLPVGLTFLGGKPKVGKSWLALQIGCAVATGGKVFGKDVQQGPVLYLALEDPDRRLMGRMTDLGMAPDKVDDADFYTLDDFLREVQTLSDPQGVNRLVDQMKARRYRFVVIDTLSRAFRGDQNDADTMTAALSPVQAAALQLDCCVMVVDHHKKAANGQDTDPILDVGGSIAKAGTADCIWGLYAEQGKAGAILHIRGRDVDDERLKLSRDPLTKSWQCDGNADAIKMTEAKNRVIDALQVLGEASCQAIANNTGQDKGNTYKLLQRMVNEMLLTRTEKGDDVVYSLVTSIPF